jgi:YidC/Oxa1 family membrane protein insertase
MDIISVPLGILLRFCYDLAKDYGLAILLFAFITRAILYPLGIKQQKNMIDMARVRPKLEELQKTYGQDKQKMAAAQQELYKQEGVSMFGGCLPLLIQFPVLFGLIAVVYDPLKYILRIPPNIIKDVLNAVKPLATNIKGNYTIYFLNAIEQNSAKISLDVPAFAKYVNEVAKLKDSFMFLGFLDLSQTPSVKILNALWLIPIFGGLTSAISSYIISKTSSASAVNENQGMAKMMLLIGPVFSVFFSFAVPAGVGFYWICTNIFMTIQSLILNKVYNVKAATEKARADYEAKKLRQAEAKKRLAQEKREELEVQNPKSKKTIDKAPQQIEDQTNKPKYPTKRKRDIENETSQIEDTDLDEQSDTDTTEDDQVK